MAFNRLRRGNRNSNPFAAVLFGGALFLGAFAVLFFNEGRIDISKVAGGSKALFGNQVESENQGKLVAISDVLHSDERLGDGSLLAEGIICI